MTDDEKEEAGMEFRKLTDQVADEVVQLFKIFADATRLRIVHYLMQTGELNVRSLCDYLEQSQPAVSHHLALLRVAGLIECRRDGKHNFYRLVSERMQEFAEVVFSSAPNEDGRVSFDTFSLNYTKTE